METITVNDHPFHAGEIAVQERTGQRHIAERHGTIISSKIVQPP